MTPEAAAMLAAVRELLAATREQTAELAAQARGRELLEVQLDLRDAVLAQTAVLADILAHLARLTAALAPAAPPTGTEAPPTTTTYTYNGPAFAHAPTDADRAAVAKAITAAAELHRGPPARRRPRMSDRRHTTAPPPVCPECGEDHAPHTRRSGPPPFGPAFLAARARVFGRREAVFRRLLGGRR